MTILVDMDGVLANFEKSFYEKWVQKYPDKASIHPEDRTSHDILADYPDCGSEIYGILGARGFFRELEPYPDGIQAIKDMLEMDLDPTICTAPMAKSTTCPMEKLEWVEEHLGTDWIKRVIIARDKTKVVGKVLIDDHVQKGLYAPHWQQLLMTRPYNKSIIWLPRISWDNWKSDIQQFI